MMIRRILLLTLLAALAACSQTPAPPGMKLGKPYSIDGQRYYPEYDPGYDKIGMASWYGPGFHGKYTASGEVFDQNDLTAAHPTLPMPSLVRVTNMQNGKSLIVRINDRGPFKRNRIIDLSKKAAQELDIRSTAQVRVQFLKEETQQYLADNGISAKPLPAIAMQHNEPPAEPQEQIVESNVSTSRDGQVVSDAAPIVTVAANDLDVRPPVASHDLPPAESAKPVTLIRQAWADDNVSLPSPPAEAPIPPLADAPPPETPAEMNKLAPASAAPDHAYYIQAGSFAAEENANKLSSRLSDIAETSVGQVDAGGKTWWRVRVGPFSNEDIAAEALSKVRGAGVPDARMVRL